MKQALLNILRTTDNPVSGEFVSRQVGISRVSVWKHIRQLNELGYEIKASSTGYHLQQSPDTPFAWEFGAREPQIHYFQKTGSTMDEARRLARDGHPHFTVVTADRQLKGRGRLQRHWVSSAGGLYVTVILRPKIPPALSHRVTFTASLVLAHLLRDTYAIDAGIKWPNDILVRNQKIAGILTELEAEADAVSYINVGIGINVNNAPANEAPQAVSLKQLLGHEVSRRELLAAFLDAFEKRMGTINTISVIPQWKKLAVTLNQAVKIEAIHEVFEGRAIDVDEDGALVLECADGSRKRVLYGDCFHRDAENP